MKRAILPGLVALLATVALAEEGRFELHELRHRIGEERWTATSDGDARRVTATTSFNDRHSAVRIKGDLRVAKDGGSLELTGTVSRFAKIDKSFEAKEGTFPIHGFAPFANQRELVRAWAKAGRPATMKGLEGELRFERKGESEVLSKKLERWSLGGLVWGEETLFLEGDELVAVVTWDAEADRFTAIRPDFEEGLALFEDLANKDQLARFPAAPLPKTPLAIVGGTILAGDAVVKDGVLVLDGAKIAAVGPRATTKVPEGAVVLHAKGKTVLPGLWDMHAHYEQAEWGPVYLASGVTTARDMGNEVEFILATRDGIREGRVAGPRLLVAGLVDSSKGAWGTTRVENAADAKAAVERFAKLGFEQVKVYDSLSKANLEALAKAAHEKGMAVVGHVPRSMNALEAIDLGLDQISHVICARTLGGAREQEAIARFKKAGTVIDPTLAIYELIFRSHETPIEKLDPGFTTLPRMVAANLDHFGMEGGKGEWQACLAWIKTLHAEGIPIVAGSDQCIPGHSLHHELELYVEHCGFTPREAIAVATSGAAKVMKLDDAGTLAAGKRADVVIIDGDPLEKISDIRKVWRTIAAGRVYDPAEQWERAGFKK